MEPIHTPNGDIIRIDVVDTPVEKPYYTIAANGLALTVLYDPEEETEGIADISIGSGYYVPGEKYAAIQFLKRDPDWAEYMAYWQAEDASLVPYISLIAQAVREMGWLGKPAEDVCNYTTFAFSDGKTISFMWRAWGGFMAALVGQRESYVKYYVKQ